MPTNSEPTLTTQKLTTRQLVERALIDAIDWQESFAASYPRGAPERAEALALAKQYRALRRRRYGEHRQPLEVATEGCETIPVQELMRRAGR